MGQPGGSNNKSGAFGEDIILEVPLGTVAKDVETGKIEFEITKHGERKILVPGGRGGLGNSNFKSPTNQSPRYAQPGEPGLEEWKILELKILADVGLVGFPNAGKSTLLSVLSAAKPKIASYPFTTLTPNLGIVRYRDNFSFVMADIPGIIEGAHSGKGLGTQFLKHIERNSILLFLISCESDSIEQEYQVLLNEVGQFNPELLDKPRILVISKIDFLGEQLTKELLSSIQLEIPILALSSVANLGLIELKDVIWEELKKIR